MSDFAKLRDAIGDNEAAINIAKSLEESMASLTSQVNKLELKNDELLKDNGKTRDKFRLVREKLGIEDLTEENINAVLKSKPDEKSQAELANLKAQLEKAYADKDSIENTYKTKMGDLVLKTELNRTGLAQKALNADTYMLLEGLVLSGASYNEDGGISFKNDDGSTSYIDGKPMTLEDKVNQLIGNPSYVGLFKPQGQGGGGSPTNGNQGGSKSFKDMTEQERVALYNRNPEEFRRLAQANK